MKQLFFLFIFMPAAIHAQELSDAVQQFVDIPAGDIAITHVKIIDGTGGPATTKSSLNEEKYILTLLIIRPDNRGHYRLNTCSCY